MAMKPPRTIPEVLHRLDATEERLRTEIEHTKDVSHRISTEADKRLDAQIKTLRLELQKSTADAASGAVQRELRDKLNKVAWTVVGITIFIVSGLITESQWMPWVHDTFKTPPQVYADIKPELKSLTLQDIAAARDQIPGHVVAALEDGTTVSYRDLFSQAALRALDDSVARSLAQTFIPQPPRRVLPADVQNYGAMPLDVVIEQIGTPDAPTNCGMQISNDSLQAIIVVPKKWPREVVSWLGCNQRYPNVTRLRFTLAGGVVVNKVALVGVQRNGQEDSLEARVTRAVAQKLGIEGEPYTGRASGRFTVHESLN